MNLPSFNRALVFTDIHLGLRSDSEQHNKDCIRFIDWAIEQFHARKCDSVIFMGDWFHNRVHVRWDTLWYSNQIVAKLSALGVPVYFIIGNHDMWHNHDRSIHSHPTLHLVPNFHVINEITPVDDVLFCPYLVGAEYNTVAQSEAKYIFGHFDIPGFLTNQSYTMPDHDGIKDDYFEAPEYVFSGHFHKRQWKKNSNGTNIVYIGNCFPHDFNDVNDRDRGCMIFERGAEPVFLNWLGPNYNRLNLSTLMTIIDQDQILVRFNEFSTLAIENDIQLQDPDLGDLRDWLGTQEFRALKIAPIPTEEQVEVGEIKAPQENITEFFMEGLNLVDTEGSKFDVELLRSIFKTNVEKHHHGEVV